MDWGILATTVQALALLGVVWRGSDIVTTNRKDWEHQEEMNIRFEKEDRTQAEARLQTAVITERIINRLDFQDRRQDIAERRMDKFAEMFDGHGRSST